MDVERTLKINSFATRCFRNVADQDYIAARLCYRYNLILQFQALSHMAIEKYFKAILLYNRIVAKRIRHDLRSARRKLDEISVVEFQFSDDTEKFICHIDDVGNNRYLEKSYFSRGPVIAQLDRAVWEIRRFCRVLDPKFSQGRKADEDRLENTRSKLKAGDSSAPVTFNVDGGRLEEFLEKKDHPARQALVWKNLYFNNRRPRTVRVPNSWMFENSPYYLFPDILDEVAQYVLVPRKVLEAYTARIKEDVHDGYC